MAEEFLVQLDQENSSLVSRSCPLDQRTQDALNCPVPICVANGQSNFATVGEFCQHWKDNHDPTAQRYSCPFCKWTGDTRDTIIAHLISAHNTHYHGSLEVSALNNWFANSEGVCQFIHPESVYPPEGYKYWAVGKLWKDFANGSCQPSQIQWMGEAMKCPVKRCNLTPLWFRTLQDLKNHWYEMHEPKMPVYMCNLCPGNLRFYSKHFKTIQGHIVTVHRDALRHGALEKQILMSVAVNWTCVDPSPYYYNMIPIELHTVSSSLQSNTNPAVSHSSVQSHPHGSACNSPVDQVLDAQPLSQALMKMINEPKNRANPSPLSYQEYLSQNQPVNSSLGVDMNADWSTGCGDDSQSSHRAPHIVTVMKDLIRRQSQDAQMQAQTQAQMQSLQSQIQMQSSQMQLQSQQMQFQSSQMQLQSPQMQSLSLMQSPQMQLQSSQMQLQSSQMQLQPSQLQSQLPTTSSCQFQHQQSTQSAVVFASHSVIANLIQCHNVPATQGLGAMNSNSNINTQNTKMQQMSLSNLSGFTNQQIAQNVWQSTFPQSSVSQSSISQSGITQSSVSQSGISQSGISQSGVSQSSISCITQTQQPIGNDNLSLTPPFPGPWRTSGEMANSNADGENLILNPASSVFESTQCSAASVTVSNSSSDSTNTHQSAERSYCDLSVDLNICDMNLSSHGGNSESSLASRGKTETNQNAISANVTRASRAQLMLTNAPILSKALLNTESTGDLGLQLEVTPTLMSIPSDNVSNQTRNCALTSSLSNNQTPVKDSSMAKESCRVISEALNTSADPIVIDIGDEDAAGDAQGTSNVAIKMNAKNTAQRNVAPDGKGQSGATALSRVSPVATDYPITPALQKDMSSCILSSDALGTMNSAKSRPLKILQREAIVIADDSDDQLRSPPASKERPASDVNTVSQTQAPPAPINTTTTTAVFSMPSTNAISSSANQRDQIPLLSTLSDNEQVAQSRELDSRVFLPNLNFAFSSQPRLPSTSAGSPKSRSRQKDIISQVVDSLIIDLNVPLGTPSLANVASNLMGLSNDSLSNVASNPLPVFSAKASPAISQPGTSLRPSAPREPLMLDPRYLQTEVESEAVFAIIHAVTGEHIQFTQSCPVSGCPKTFCGTPLDLALHWQRFHMNRWLYLLCPACAGAPFRTTSFALFCEHLHAQHITMIGGVEESEAWRDLWDATVIQAVSNTESKYLDPGPIRLVFYKTVTPGEKSYDQTPDEYAKALEFSHPLCYGVIDQATQNTYQRVIKCPVEKCPLRSVSRMSNFPFHWKFHHEQSMRALYCPACPRIDYFEDNGKFWLHILECHIKMLGTHFRVEAEDCLWRGVWKKTTINQCYVDPGTFRLVTRVTTTAKASSNCQPLKPFACAKSVNRISCPSITCNECFNARWNLDAHFRSFHMPYRMGYACKICGSSTSTLQSMYRHHKKRHEDIELDRSALKNHFWIERNPRFQQAYVRRGSKEHTALQQLCRIDIGHLFIGPNGATDCDSIDRAIKDYLNKAFQSPAARSAQDGRLPPLPFTPLPAKSVSQATLAMRQGQQTTLIDAREVGTVILCKKEPSEGPLTPPPRPYSPAKEDEEEREIAEGLQTTFDDEVDDDDVDDGICVDTGVDSGHSSSEEDIIITDFKAGRTKRVNTSTGETRTTVFTRTVGSPTKGSSPQKYAKYYENAMVLLQKVQQGPNSTASTATLTDKSIGQTKPMTATLTDKSKGQVQPMTAPLTDKSKGQTTPMTATLTDKSKGQVQPMTATLTDKSKGQTTPMTATLTDKSKGQTTPMTPSREGPKLVVRLSKLPTDVVGQTPPQSKVGGKGRMSIGATSGGEHENSGRSPSSGTEWNRSESDIDSEQMDPSCEHETAVANDGISPRRPKLTLKKFTPSVRSPRKSKWSVVAKRMSPKGGMKGKFRGQKGNRLVKPLTLMRAKTPPRATVARNDVRPKISIAIKPVVKLFDLKKAPIRSSPKNASTAAKDQTGTPERRKLRSITEQEHKNMFDPLSMMPVIKLVNLKLSPEKTGTLHLNLNSSRERRSVSEDDGKSGGSTVVTKSVQSPKIPVASLCLTPKRSPISSVRAFEKDEKDLRKRSPVVKLLDLSKSSQTKELLRKSSVSLNTRDSLLLFAALPGKDQGDEESFVSPHSSPKINSCENDGLISGSSGSDNDPIEADHAQSRSDRHLVTPGTGVPEISGSESGSQTCSQTHQTPSRNYLSAAAIALVEKSPALSVRLTRCDDSLVNREIKDNVVSVKSPVTSRLTGGPVRSPKSIRPTPESVKAVTEEIPVITLSSDSESDEAGSTRSALSDEESDATRSHTTGPTVVESSPRRRRLFNKYRKGKSQHPNHVSFVMVKFCEGTTCPIKNCSYLMEDKDRWYRHWQETHIKQTVYYACPHCAWICSIKHGRKLALKHVQLHGEHKDKQPLSVPVDRTKYKEPILKEKDQAKMDEGSAESGSKENDDIETAEKVAINNDDEINYDDNDDKESIADDDGDAKCAKNAAPSINEGKNEVKSNAKDSKDTGNDRSVDDDGDDDDNFDDIEEDNIENSENVTSTAGGAEAAENVDIDGDNGASDKDLSDKAVSDKSSKKTLMKKKGIVAAVKKLDASANSSAEMGKKAKTDKAWDKAADKAGDKGENTMRVRFKHVRWEKGMRCPIEGCVWRFVQQSDFMRHWNLYHIAKVPAIQCEFCEEQYSPDEAFYDFKKHLENSHRPAITKAGDVKTLIENAKQVVIDNEKFVAPLVSKDYECAVDLDQESEEEQVMDINDEDEEPDLALAEKVKAGRGTKRRGSGDAQSKAKKRKTTSKDDSLSDDDAGDSDVEESLPENGVSDDSDLEESVAKEPPKPERKSSRASKKIVDLTEDDEEMEVENEEEDEESEEKSPSKRSPKGGKKTSQSPAAKTKNASGDGKKDKDDKKLDSEDSDDDEEEKTKKTPSRTPRRKSETPAAEEPQGVVRKGLPKKNTKSRTPKSGSRSRKARSRSSDEDSDAPIKKTDKKTPAKTPKSSANSKKTPITASSVNSDNDSDDSDVPAKKVDKKTLAKTPKASANSKKKTPGPARSKTTGRSKVSVATLCRQHGLVGMGPMVHLWRLSDSQVDKMKSDVQKGKEVHVPDAIPTLPDRLVNIDPLSVIPSSRAGALAYKAWLLKMSSALEVIGKMVDSWDAGPSETAAAAPEEVSVQFEKMDSEGEEEDSMTAVCNSLLASMDPAEEPDKDVKGSSSSSSKGKEEPRVKSEDITKDKTGDKPAAVDKSVAIDKLESDKTSDGEESTDVGKTGDQSDGEKESKDVGGDLEQEENDKDKKSVSDTSPELDDDDSASSAEKADAKKDSTDNNEDVKEQQKNDNKTEEEITNGSETSMSATVPEKTDIPVPTENTADTKELEKMDTSEPASKDVSSQDFPQTSSQNTQNGSSETASSAES